MRNIILTFCLALCFTGAFAQGSLQGTLLDEKGAPLRYANVSVLKTTKGTLPVATSLTDSTGRFTLTTPTAGTYFLQFTTIGFAKLETDSFAITTPDFSKDFGSITLKAETKKPATENAGDLSLRPVDHYQLSSGDVPCHRSMGER